MNCRSTIKQILAHFSLLLIYFTALAFSLLVLHKELFVLYKIGVYEGCLQRLVKSLLMFATLVFLPTTPFIHSSYLGGRGRPLILGGALACMLWMLYLNARDLFRSTWYMTIAASIELLVLDYWLWKCELQLASRAVLLVSLVMIAHQLYEIYYVYYKLLFHKLLQYKLWQHFYLAAILASTVYGIGNKRGLAIALILLAAANLYIYFRAEMLLPSPTFPFNILIAISVRLTPLLLLINFTYTEPRLAQSFCILGVLVKKFVRRLYSR